MEGEVVPSGAGDDSARQTLERCPDRVPVRVIETDQLLFGFLLLLGFFFLGRRGALVAGARSPCLDGGDCALLGLRWDGGSAVVAAAARPDGAGAGGLCGASTETTSPSAVPLKGISCSNVAGAGLLPSATAS